jgi:hypothetical protein
MNDLPGRMSGQEADCPSRLTRRQNMMPMATSRPLLKRMLLSGSRISAS